MSNSKISALTSATTPLDGTEVLPIVQNSATKKVAVDDLTVKNIRSNATSGILQIVGPTIASTRIATVPDANWTAARTDAAQTFTGDQTLSTGNLVIGTSGKGIDFSATAGTGTSELLADYEEGTWTPTFQPATGAFTTITYSGSRNGRYTKIGNQVTVRFFLRTTAITVGTAAGALSVGGLPFTVGSNFNGTGIAAAVVAWANNFPIAGLASDGTTTIGLRYRDTVDARDFQNTPADLGTGANANDIYMSLTYFV
jgi:hypothetical protein